MFGPVWEKRKKRKKRVKIMKPYQVNRDLVKLAKEDYIFHALSASHREKR